MSTHQLLELKLFILLKILKCKNLIFYEDENGNDSILKYKFINR